MKRPSILISFTLFSLYATSQHWVRQHPFVEFAPLHAITFDANGNGWAVGEESLILHTNNWGGLWTVQGEDVPEGLVFESVTIIPGTNANGVLVGGPGLFLSTNGGASWNPVDPGTSVDGIKRIHAFSPMHVIVLGRSNGVRTTNAGQDWIEFAMPDNSANAAYFTDMQNGWAGSGPFNAYQVYKTTNGGMDWDLADDAIYPIITDIEMINTQVGFLSGRDYIFKTTNGGADWEQLHDDVQPSLTGMHVVNENIIWSGLNNGFVFVTLNGGADWEQVNPNVINSNQVFDVFAREDGKVWVPGKYASVQYSMDNGISWEDQTPGAKNSLFDIDFDGNTGFAVGSEGIILRTTNAGAIWENVGFDPQTQYFGVSVLNAGGTRHVYVGSSTGDVLHSLNDGDDWEVIGQGLGQIRCLVARSTQEIVVGTETSIQYTSNGGQMWMPASAPLTNLVAEIQFSDALTGYAAVNDGNVLKTTDGGASWNPVLQRSNYKFSGVHVHDALQGWAVAELKDSVWATQNGGMSWTAYKLPANTFWQDIQFMDADTGYISGGSAGDGRILRTTNGGETWTVSFDESEKLNGMFVREGEDYAWVVGFGGNILHFSPCAVAPEISDLTGDIIPCEGETIVYEVNSNGVTIFTWTVPADWTIIGNDNSARIEVLVGEESGDITIQGANACGTTTATLSLGVVPGLVENVTITENGGILSTSLINVSYHWFLDGSEIPGATEQTFIPLVSGTYTLIVVFPSGCTSVSNEIFVMISTTRDVQKIALQVFPNPAGEFIHLQGVIDEPVMTITLFDCNGRTVFLSDLNLSQIDVHDLHCGVYIVQATSEKHVYTGRFVKE